MLGKICDLVSPLVYTKAGAIIVLYQHKGWNAPLHYVAGIKAGGDVGESYRFYNDSYYKTKYEAKSISIWRYIDLLEENASLLGRCRENQEGDK